MDDRYRIEESTHEIECTNNQTDNLVIAVSSYHHIFNLNQRSLGSERY